MPTSLKETYIIKALFLDIDGTLMSLETHLIPTSTIEILGAAKVEDIQTFITTGRPRVIINNLAPLQNQKPIDGCITMNGTYCLVNDTVVYKNPIPTTEIDILTKFYHERSIPCIPVGEHNICAGQPGEIVTEIFNNQLKTDPIEPQPCANNHSNREFYQLTPFINAEEEQMIVPFLPNCEMGRWHPVFVDVTAKGNIKQHGIDEVIRRLGTRLEKTMAFDNGGDSISMLRHAGIEAATGNAKDDVKIIANYVTASVSDNGIADALKHFGILG